MEGWIKVHRRIKECWLWNTNEPFDRRSAWIDLLMSANHEGKKVVLGKEIIYVERGSFITSIRKLCDRWKWSNTRTSNFLELLQNDKMIRFKSDTKKTVVTIENYGLYQFGDEKKRHENDTKTTREHTNKNDKNEKNEKKENKYSSKVFDENSDSYKIAFELRRRILENDSKIRVPNDDGLQRWAIDIDRMIRIDKRTIEDIKQVLEFSQNNSFWKSNILSASKLREKFDTLLLQSKENNKPKTSNRSGFIPQQTNFKQRDYDDAYYESLYESLHENTGGEVKK